MTYLRLSQLVVSKKGNIVFSEKFPHKINIIRGENGTGKSTIANFIYFLLGGDFIDWLPEARACDYVFGEVDFNGKVLTLRREIIDKIMQPMQIFYGSLDVAVKSSIEGWQIFPYRKSENKESFSQILFNLLEFPEVTTENSESITMNQVLRLLYIDQISPLNTLIKNVDFDSPLLRQAIGYLLLGIYDDKLFNEQLLLREKKRRHNELGKEFSAVREIYQSSNLPIDIENIEYAIREKELALQKIDETLLNRPILTNSDNKLEVFNRIKELRSVVDGTSNEISESIYKLNKIDADILDSSDFVDELSRQIDALKESMLVRATLGKLDISYCPSCLTKLAPIDVESKCHLCKEDVDINDHKSRILRIQQELQGQIKESVFLLEKKRNRKVELENEIKFLKKRIVLENNELNNYIESTNSKVDRKHDELLIRKGELRSEIESALNQKKAIQSFLDLKKRLDFLSKEITILDETVKVKEGIQKNKMKVALNRIQHYALILLKGDGNIESGFSNASRIGIDFSKNLYFVDERNNFSASSLVILKNSIRFGIFFASLELDFMRYPRFILCDNMEDKGMREERSHNFQMNVVKLAESIKKDFQIIFTTSMIDPNLESTSFTVGTHYQPDNKSLTL